MDIASHHLFIGFLIFTLICYMFYKCLCQNAELIDKLGKKDNFQNIENNKKETNIANKLLNKGLKAFSSANNLEELPKFLDIPDSGSHSK